MNPVFRVALALRRYSHPLLSAGYWFQQPRRYQNPRMLKPLYIKRLRDSANLRNLGCGTRGQRPGGSGR